MTETREVVHLPPPPKKNFRAFYKLARKIVLLDVARNEQILDRGRRIDQYEQHAPGQPNAISGRKPVHVEQRTERGEFPTHTRHHRRSNSDHSVQPDPEEFGGE